MQVFFAGEGKAGENKNLSVLAYAEVFWWARVDYASRAEKEPGSRLPAAASCLGRHAHPAGRSPNSSSLFLPLAAVVAVAVRIHPCAPFARRIKTETPVPGSDTGVLGGRGWITRAAQKRSPGRGSQRLHRALGGTRILLAAAPTAPPCFCRWQRSSLLLFESTLAPLLRDG